MKNYASDFHPQSSEETPVQQTFTSLAEKVMQFFKVSGNL